jgi:preprotein translocase subunit SecE
MFIKKILNKIITFLKEVHLEMKKVNWLTKKEAIRYTLIVIAVSVVVAVFLGTLDFIFSDLRNCYILMIEPCYIRRVLEF